MNQQVSFHANPWQHAGPSRDSVPMDAGYSMLPTGITPMWGIYLNVASESQHAAFEIYRDRPENGLDLFLAMLLGRDIVQ